MMNPNDKSQIKSVTLNVNPDNKQLVAVHLFVPLSGIYPMLDTLKLNNHLELTFFLKATRLICQKRR